MKKLLCVALMGVMLLAACSKSSQEEDKWDTDRKLLMVELRIKAIKYKCWYILRQKRLLPEQEKVMFKITSNGKACANRASFFLCCEFKIPTSCDCLLNTIQTTLCRNNVKGKINKFIVWDTSMEMGVQVKKACF